MVIMHRMRRKWWMAFGVFMLAGFGAAGDAQTCTGLCQQQVTCPGGGTTSISGTVYAPNGTDPLPNLLVYIPNAPVDAFTSGVSCPVVGQPPSGSPLVGTTTATDGTFTLTNVPVGTNIPLVIQTGRWRRQVVVPSTSACTNTTFSSRLPRNQSEGDIPKFAISTGREDAVECVLRKVGIDDAEFTDASGTGRINLFQSTFGPGALVDSATPTADALMANQTTLNGYDVLMLPCEGGQATKPGGQLSNMMSFANAGGRVYASHFSYDWMYQNGPFANVVNWAVSQANPSPDPGTATIDTTFAEGATLSNWLQIVGGTTTPGQVAISTLRHNFNGVVAPTQSWLTLNNAAYGDPVMQFTFNTPIGGTNQCGRVLYNEYHVENPTTVTTNKMFPAECTSGTVSPQEKLLEFSLFDLTGDGGSPTLTPTTRDFGSVPIGFTTAAQSFVWTNNSIFASSVTSATATGDYAVTTKGCASVKAGASCEVDVTFTPTALGDRPGLLSVVSSGNTVTATLTGRGTADLTIAPAALNFGNSDVGQTTAAQVVTVTNNTPAAIPLGAPTLTGDFAVASTTCGPSLAAMTSCGYNVTFTPATTGPRSGSIAVNSTNSAYAGVSSTLSGNGVDFAIAISPSSGSVIAGQGLSMNVSTTPIAGFAASVTMRCTVVSAGSTCIPSTVTFTPALTELVALTTTSQYTVIGYSGMLWIVGLGSGCFLWWTRRSHQAGRRMLVALMLAAVGLGLNGCSGKTPAANNPYTAAGIYPVVVTATDGFLTHSATYMLTVTVK